MTDLAPLNIPRLLKEFDLQPRKSLGQNFLVDETALERIVTAAGIAASEVVLEIGPGLGSLTRHLAARARTVTAVELDQHLLPVLEYVLSPHANVRLVCGDILSLDPPALAGSPDYLVVANIPYHITSAILRHLLESNPPPGRIILTVQKEVAERICALPGSMSLLSLSVQVFGRAGIVANIPAEAFFPPPRVDSAVIVVETAPHPAIPPTLRERFFRLARAGFSQKRKTLRNALSAGLHLPPTHVEDLLVKAGIDPRRRAETLHLEEWGRLTQALSSDDLP